MKILTILGARPQFIKAGSVSRTIMEHNALLVDGYSLLQRGEQRALETKNQKLITEIIVHTGQHYDANMSDVFFDELKIPKPDYLLGIGGKSHGAMTGQMIEKIEEVCLKENPDWVMVYGDTNSTLAGAIVASKLHIKLAHIEAGLRSFNMAMPEEVNRILTDRVSNVLFCPTDTAIENLKNEGYDKLKCKIIKSGDVMQDGALFYKQCAVKPTLPNNQKLETENYILCTIHRAENTDDEHRLRSIFEALNVIAKEKQVILPLHPRTKKILKNLNLNTQNLTLIDPVGYLDMVWLIDHCDLVMTDSGGLQKEAYFFEKQCITLRDETEWVELVACGVNSLVGANKNKILDAYKNNSLFNIESSKLDLYGGGKASANIIKELSNE
jgi:UDP-GlcNAc3NAcA epimerase